jgi:single-strand DNA-binding protein
LASNRFFKQDSGMEKEVGFFDVESWSKLAEHCYNQGRKGRGVRVVGRLKQDRWNGTDGKPHSRVAIVAEHVEFRPEFKREDPRGGDVSTTDIFAEAAAQEDEFASLEENMSAMAVAEAQGVNF